VVGKIAFHAVNSLGILLTLVVVVACSAGGSGGQDAGAPPRPGGTVTIGLRQEPASLDPLSLSDSELGIAEAIYDPLIVRASPGGGLASGLADRWTSSADLRTWTLHLRRGVRFHDGTPFDAAAVVANVQRHVASGSRSLSRVDALLIGDLRALDGSTVAISLKSPWVDFPEVLAGPIGLMASPAALQREGYGYGRRPVGTGPFVFSEWTAGDHLTVTRNRSYWRAGLPHLDRVTWRTVPGDDARYAGLVAGRLDVLPEATVDQAERAGGDHRLTVWSRAGDGATVLMLDTTAPPFDAVDARLALAYATDRRQVVARAGRGLARTATGPFPPGSAWDAGAAGPGPDARRARAALARYGRRLAFTIDVPSDPVGRRYGQVLQAQWRTLGIDVAVESMGQDALAGAAAERRFQAQLVRYGDWSDPDRLLFDALVSRGTAANHTGYASEAVDVALVGARATADPGVRRGDYGIVQRALAGDQPYVWLQYDTEVVLSRARVRGAGPVAGSAPGPESLWLAS
jgi:ABC-type transport system substrate-binding protein